MPGKTLTPEQMIEAVSLRAAGHTLASISDRCGISVRTLNRLFERHGAKKGEVNDALVQAAKRDLIDAVTSNERIKHEAARLVADDIAHTRLLRSRMADATEHLTATNLEEAALLMRAAAAYSTALKNTSHTLRLSMGTDKAMSAVDVQELPALLLMEISDEDALRMTQEHAGQMASTGGGGKPYTGSTETGGLVDDHDDDDRAAGELVVACS